MVQRQVTLTGGAGVYTSIRATTPLHYLRVWKDDERDALAFTYRLPDDSFATTYQTDESQGDIIERTGHGASGLLGKPPGYVAADTPALGDEILRIRAVDDSAAVINILER